MDDGSCLNSGIMASGFIIRDSLGRKIAAKAEKLGKGNPLLSETLALKKSLLEAIKMKLQNIIIEGDNDTILKSIHGKNCPWQIDMISTDIALLLQKFNSYTISFIPRSLNTVADFLAKQGHSKNSEQIVLLPEFKTLVLRDTL